MTSISTSFCCLARVALIRFRGHFPKAGYDVHDGKHETEPEPTHFTEEFMAGAVRLVLEEGKTVSAATRDLDLTES